MFKKLKFLILIPSLALVFAFNTTSASAQTQTSAATKEELRTKISALEEIIEKARGLTKNLIKNNKDPRLDAQLERLGNILGIAGKATSTKPQGKLSVDLKVNNFDGPLQVSIGKQTFTWEAKNANSCKANVESTSGQIWSDEDWKGNIKTSGKASVYTANEKEGRTVYRITCFNDTESTTDTVFLTFEYPGAGPERLKTSYELESGERAFVKVKYNVKDLTNGEMIEVIPLATPYDYVSATNKALQDKITKSYKFNINHYPSKEQVTGASNGKSQKFKALQDGSVTIGSCLTGCPNSIPELSFTLKYIINLLDKNGVIIESSKYHFSPAKG